MATYTITISKKGLTPKQIEKMRDAISDMCKDASVMYEQTQTPASRAERLDRAKSNAEDAKSEIAELLEELQNWLDGMPENLKSGSKAGEIEEAISTLEQMQSSLDEVVDADVSFPGMR